jgi:hypothetical protein
MTYRDERVVSDDTGVVERERVVEREIPVATTPVAPANAVNVNSAGYATAAPGPLYYVRRTVILIFGIILALIAIRFILLALGANADNGLVSGIYNISEWFVAPFRGVFNLNQYSPNGVSVFDVSAIVAFFGWLLIEVLLLAILRVGDSSRRVAA